MSKRSCVFQDVCLQSAADQKGLSAVLHGRVQPAHAHMLKQHLVKIFEGIVNAANITVSIAPDGSSAVPASALQPPTIIWRPAGANQYSFGHALINEAFSAFLVLQNHYQQIPKNMQLLAVGGWHPVLRNVLAGTITGHATEFHAAVTASSAAACFSQLLVGDGGYIAASRGSLAGTGTAFGREPSFFSSANWRKFRQHALQMHGIQQEHPPKPLIVLNDKRFGASNQTDRRMLLDIEPLVSNLSALYPQAEVRAVRFRDLNMTEQLRLVAHATVFITTQGSSAFRLVFLPEGATCVYVGSPKSADATKWVPFYELDRWFPLSYVQFQRYEVALNSTAEYDASPMPGHWAPGDPAEAREWWLYNAHVRLQLDRLKVMLDPALQVP
ncbi:hypothetical protein OEZ86_013246 [Tetradesmus obliquus]|nr:hypothetical protein OEZ86_013246 [Tetradesmus obliquus]